MLVAAVDGADVLVWVCAPTHLTGRLPVSRLHAGGQNDRVTCQQCSTLHASKQQCITHTTQTSLNCLLGGDRTHRLQSGSVIRHEGFRPELTSSSEPPLPPSSLLPPCCDAARDVPLSALPPADNALNRRRYDSTCRQTHSTARHATRTTSTVKPIDVFTHSQHPTWPGLSLTSCTHMI